MKTGISARNDIIFSLLAGAGLDEGDLEHIRAVKEETKDHLDEVATKLGLISELEISRALAAQYGLKFAEKFSTPDLPICEKHLSPSFLRKHRILPLVEDGRSISAAVVDPGDITGIRGVEYSLDKEVIPFVTTITRFESAYSRLYDDKFESRLEPSLDVSADASRLKDLASEAPTIRLVNTLLASAVERHASDIHFEPGERQTSIRMRIDGVLVEHEKVANVKALAIASRLKILANLDIAERRRPQDGRLNVTIEGRSIDIRVSAVPTASGESIVLRILDRACIEFSYDALGFTDSVVRAIERSLTRPHGIMLVTGPTGSGKTTTLYTLLSKLNRNEQKILTIEDPIEYRMPGISQTQAKPDIGLTFAAALRSFLRHDPDVMMVGEIRDVETARIAVQSALTGHFVISTLHTNDAPSAITRLIDIGVEDYLIASALVCVVAQRLVRKLCNDCKIQHDITDETILARLAEMNFDDPQFFRPVGCEACAGFGYIGRTAIAETLEIDEGIKEFIRGDADSDALKIFLQEKNFRSLYDCGLATASRGITTVAEVRRVTNG